METAWRRRWKNAAQAGSVGAGKVHRPSRIAPRAVRWTIGIVRGVCRNKTGDAAHGYARRVRMARRWKPASKWTGKRASTAKGMGSARWTVSRITRAFSIPCGSSGITAHWTHVGSQGAHGPKAQTGHNSVPSWGWRRKSEAGPPVRPHGAHANGASSAPTADITTAARPPARRPATDSSVNSQ